MLYVCVCGLGTCSTCVITLMCALHNSVQDEGVDTSLSDWERYAAQQYDRLLSEEEYEQEKYAWFAMFLPHFFNTLLCIAYLNLVKVFVLCLLVPPLPSPIHPFFASQL